MGAAAFVAAPFFLLSQKRHNVGTLLAYVVPFFFVQLRKKERCRWHIGKST
nr:MAG TPA: hypothetical protein [Caudoviricetes sp.]